MKNTWILYTIVSISLLGVGMFWAAQLPKAQTQSMSQAAFAPTWTAQGELVLPTDYHEWVFLGSPLTPNALNGGQANFPEYHNVYVHPEALKVYRRTGAWPEGTVMLKELQLTRPSKQPDGSSTEVSGRGYFPGQRNGIRTNWALEGTAFPLLPAQANALYRIVEEALRNVEQHAEAKEVAVKLTYGRGVTVSVQDDGRGFEPSEVETDRYGLVGIRERATLIDGHVSVDAAPDHGTTLTIHIAEPWEE